MRRAFLNVDAGELPGEPDELLALADVVNIACGGHAGDETSMRHVLAHCRAGVRPRAGAHPSYPDRAGFGRVPMTLGADSLLAAVAEQCHALASVARAEGDVPLGFAKLHGALYHAANADETVARAALRGIIEALGWELTLIGPPAGGALFDAARELGLAYATEGFADRGVRADGSLVPRGEPGALVTDPARAATRARALREQVGTVCVHGDTPGAVEIARAVRAALDAP